ncbi:MAG: sigma-70 family RNA polymerase sigma factor [Bacteroidales bacterium]|nr:sigma-70 family RNA polymerase sigma factor [Bacteroidales bacterium]
MVDYPNLSEKAQKDYQLVLKAREGDQKAYASLMSRYKDSIYYMVLKMVNNFDDADDLTIEAFGKAFKNIDQYSPQFAFSTWLFKIATNNSIDFLRKKRGITVSLDRTDDEGNEYQPAVPDVGLTPEETIIKNQKVDIMRSVVKTLKPRYRSLIELRYFKEYSYEEISQEMELPLGTVKAQLFRARELLLNILEKKSEKI